MAEDASSGLLAQTTSRSGEISVRFRKGEKNEKDVFVEVWTSQSSQALKSTLKVTDKMSKVYNDVVFGGIAWSQDESKICFIGEQPEPASYKNFWDAKKPEEDDKKSAEGEEEKKKEEEKKDKPPTPPPKPEESKPPPPKDKPPTPPPKKPEDKPPTPPPKPKEDPPKPPSDKPKPPPPPPKDPPKPPAPKPSPEEAKDLKKADPCMPYMKEPQVWMMC